MSEVCDLEHPQSGHMYTCKAFNLYDSTAICSLEGRVLHGEGRREREGYFMEKEGGGRWKGTSWRGDFMERGGGRGKGTSWRRKEEGDGRVLHIWRGKGEEDRGGRYTNTSQVVLT